MKQDVCGLTWHTTCEMIGRQGSSSFWGLIDYSQNAMDLTETLRSLDLEEAAFLLPSLQPAWGIKVNWSAAFHWLYLPALPSGGQPCGSKHVTSQFLNPNCLICKMAADSIIGLLWLKIIDVSYHYGFILTFTILLFFFYNNQNSSGQRNRNG